MKKILLVVIVTMLGMYILKAQEPCGRFSAEIGFSFWTKQGFLEMTARWEDYRISCTKHKSLYEFTTDKDAFSFNKPIYTSEIGSFCGEDFYLYASGMEAMRIRRDGYIFIPFDRSFTFGEEIGEGYNRLRILHNRTHAYIDYKDNLYFRADLNYISALTLYGNGSVGIGIGTSYDYGNYRNMGYKLAVNGGIICEEVKVIRDVPDADYVFEDNYNLSTLPEVETFIKQNKHLPNIPSAEEFKTNGYKVGEMDEMLLRKIEELTLYIIELQKQIDELKKTKEKGGE